MPIDNRGRLQTLICISKTASVGIFELLAHVANDLKVNVLLGWITSGDSSV